MWIESLKMKQMFGQISTHICTFSIKSQSDLKIGDQTSTANSKSGRINVGYKVPSKLLSKRVIFDVT